MKTSIIRSTLLAGVFLTGWKACVTFAAPPVISNVTASQRAGTKLVDITYNLSDADGDLQNVQVQVSGDAGLTYTIPATALSGAVGGGVVPGNGRSIVWNAGVDWNGQYVPLAKVRVTAQDGTTPAPPPGFVYIPAGVFQMGDNLDGMTDAMPVHAVQVDGFFMERFECSKELWQSVQSWSVGRGYNINVGAFAGNGHPVGGITWYDAVKWCNARSEMEGRTPVYYADDTQATVYRTGNFDLTNAKVKWSASGYRLPTEAEWEKAARGGALGLRYPWGNAVNGSQSNYLASGDPFESNGTAPCGYYNGAQVPSGVDMSNAYGLYDMAGNVFEWCWDWNGSTYYSDPSAGNNPRGPITGGNRTTRGGSFGLGTSYLRCASRFNTYAPGANSSYVGLRCARGL